MKKIVFLVFVAVILNGCAESTALLGPSYTLTKSGSVVQTGNSLAISYGLKKTIKQTNTDTIVSSLIEGDIRECQTIHSSVLSEIFFDKALSCPR